jgi:hypothetical protein
MADLGKKLKSSCFLAESAKIRSFFDRKGFFGVVFNYFAGRACLIDNQRLTYTWPASIKHFID